MENKFKEGEVVIERIRPSQKLMVKKYVSKLYYCKAMEDPSRKELVFYERELMPEALRLRRA